MADKELAQLEKELAALQNELFNNGSEMRQSERDVLKSKINSTEWQISQARSEQKQLEDDQVSQERYDQQQALDEIRHEELLEQQREIAAQEAEWREEQARKEDRRQLSEWKSTADAGKYYATDYKPRALEFISTIETITQGWLKLMSDHYQATLKFLPLNQQTGIVQGVFNPAPKPIPPDRTTMNADAVRGSMAKSPET